MAKGPRISVPISGDDRAKLKRRLAALQEMSEAGLARILLHYAIPRAGEAMKEAMDAVKQEEEQHE